MARVMAAEEDVGASTRTQTQTTEISPTDTTQIKENEKVHVTETTTKAQTNVVVESHNEVPAQTARLV